MSAISPSTTSTPSSKTTKELSTPDLNAKIKIEPKDDSNNISTPIRKNSEEALSTSLSDSSVEVSISQVPLASKEKSTKPFSSFDTTNSSNNFDVNTPSSLNQQQSSIVSNKKSEFSYFKIGVSEDRNKRCRRTMEDAHSFFYDFAGIEGQGFFAVFDGHAGKQAAEWCGNHFHETFQEVLQENKNLPIPEVFHLSFLRADKQLNQNAGKHSGCTAIAAFLRSEEIAESESTNGKEPVSNGAIVKSKQKRVLYTANVGDARAVLSRNGLAIRLSYDHKGSDAQEAKRIVDAGGFVMNNRVNGVLAVTRSLGDSSMKEFVVGSPYTTETELTENDPFLILACDGLWDVCGDQDAVDLIKDIKDPQMIHERITNLLA
ncbi:PP2C-domain-containing protein [Rhizophagus clarus]|uniref:PP2C-domain-containing protein n=1 Tax=Rhizophagus clarus TaxID=94130 RepID=A0A8H3QNE3_9GLOM|nr:PP2C-domain-containing protein [Rhizophagus clarus]